MRIPILCPKAKYRVETICGDAGKWYWRVVCIGNNEPMAHSETYETHDACLDSALAVAKNAGWPMAAIMGRP